MNFEICPNCGSELRPNARFCTKCGYSLSRSQNDQASTVPVTPAHCPQCGTTLRNPQSVKCEVCGCNFQEQRGQYSTPQTNAWTDQPHIDPIAVDYGTYPPGKQTNKALLIFGIIAAIGILGSLIVFGINFISSRQSQNPMNQGYEQQENNQVVFPTDAGTVVENSPIEYDNTTSTPRPTNEPEQPTRTPTENTNCPGARPQRVKNNDTVEICTYRDRVNVRVEPDPEANSLFRIYPGTYVKIVDGPECTAYTSWWKVLVKKGTEVYYPSSNTNGTLQSDQVGWLREGSAPPDSNYGTPDPDDYFICK